MLAFYKYLIIVLGLIIYKVRPNWLMLYWILFFPLIFPFYVNYMNIYESDSFREAINSTQGSLCNLSILIVVYEILVNHARIRLANIKGPLIALVFYLIIHNVLTHFSLPIIIDNIRMLLVPIAPICLMKISPQTIPNIKTAYIMTLVIVTIQLVWCILELNGIYPFVYFYLGHSAIGENLVAGTFHRFNAMSNFLTTIFLIFSIDYYSNHRIKTSVYFIVSFAILAMILMSGAKMSIIMFFFILLATSVFLGNMKQKMKYLLCFLCLFLIFNNLFNTIINTEGVERINEGFSNIIKSGSKDENTLSLSWYLLDNYFGQSPLIGHGLSWKGEYAYGTSYEITFFKADARMAYTIIEYGLFGLILFLTFFTKLIRYFAINSAIHKTIIKITITYLLILTITEGGFFDINVLLPIFVYFYLILYQRNNEYAQKLNRLSKKHV